MAEQQNLPHSLTLCERKKLAMAGATEVVSFAESCEVIRTPMGTLVVQGQDLQLKTLDGGNVAVEGQIIALSYEENRSAGGWLSRLIR